MYEKDMPTPEKIIRSLPKCVQNLADPVPKLVIV